MTPTQKLFAVAPLLTLLGCRQAAAEASGGQGERARAAVARLIAEKEAPGLQYAFYDLDGVLFSAEAGQADLGAKTAVGPDTLFHGYSVTKTFTAAALLKLAAEGKVDLDQPISRYLPELEDPRSPTLWQTLAHTAGYENPIPIGWAHLSSEHETFDHAAFFRRVAQEHGKVERAPGEKLAYSNVGYLFLGEVIARASGRSYTRYVEEELIAPLKLEGGAQLRFTFAEPSAHARGYIASVGWLNASLGLFIDRGKFIAARRDGWTELKDMQVDGPAYGGLIGNARGFGRYLQALLRSEGPFTPELVELLLTPQKTKGGAAIPMGLSWFRGEVGGEPYADHAGGGGGYYCEIRLYPRARRASVLLTNRTGIRNDHLLDRLDPILLPPQAVAAR